MVIGPTPPGTGVIAPATSFTASKSTSPTRTALRQQAGTPSGQAIDVLSRVDRADHRVLIDLIGQRNLDQDPVHLVVGVQVVDEPEQILLSSRRGQPVVDRAHSHLLGLL